jgi:hypothetical protein
MPLGVSGSPAGSKAVEDRHGGIAIELLVEDRFRQAMKGRLAKLHLAGADLLDDGRQHRVRLLQMIDCLPHRVLAAKGSIS